MCVCWNETSLIARMKTCIRALVIDAFFFYDPETTLGLDLSQFIFYMVN